MDEGGDARLQLDEGSKGLEPHDFAADAVPPGVSLAHVGPGVGGHGSAADAQLSLVDVEVVDHRFDGVAFFAEVLGSFDVAPRHLGGS